MINLDRILKSRGITLLTKVHIIKAMFCFVLFCFAVIMYGCESWTMKKLFTEELMLLNCTAGDDS